MHATKVILPYLFLVLYQFHRVSAIFTIITCANDLTLLTAENDCINAAPTTANVTILYNNTLQITTLRCDDTDPNAFNTNYLETIDKRACVCFFQGGNYKNGTSTPLSFYLDNANCGNMCQGYLTNANDATTCNVNLQLGTPTASSSSKSTLPSVTLSTAPSGSASSKPSGADSLSVGSTVGSVALILSVGLATLFV